MIPSTTPPIESQALTAALVTSFSLAAEISSGQFLHRNLRPKLIQ
jgi:hypothetical protein